MIQWATLMTSRGCFNRVPLSVVASSVYIGCSTSIAAAINFKFLTASWVVSQSLFCPALYFL